MKTRGEIKNQAKQNFIGQYWVSVSAFVIVGLLTWIISWFSGGPSTMDIVSKSSHFAPTYGLKGLEFISLLVAAFLTPPLTVGYASYSTDIYRNEKGDIAKMFNDGFSSYWRNVGGIIWMQLFTFLWTLLFIIPGIVKAFAYSMTPYILADFKNVSATDALKISMKMTKGYKGDIFVLCLSFIGWGILTALTGGLLAVFFTGPYVSTSIAGMYCELKQKALDKGLITADELGI